MIPWGKNYFRYFHNFRKKEFKNIFSKMGFKILELGEIRRKKNNNLYVVGEK
jgi:hypothetical protein